MFMSRMTTSNFKRTLIYQLAFTHPTIFHFILKYGLGRSLQRNWKENSVCFNCHMHVDQLCIHDPYQIKVLKKSSKLTLQLCTPPLEAFLMASIIKLRCNHQIDWDEIVHITTMACNIFLHSSAGEAPFDLMFGCDPFMPTVFKVLLPNLRFMGDEKYRIHLDPIWKIYMMAVLNLKMARDKSPPPPGIPVKQILK